MLSSGYTPVAVLIIEMIIMITRIFFSSEKWKNKKINTMKQMLVMFSLIITLSGTWDAI